MDGGGKKFSYYRRLRAAQKRIYDKSDAITGIELPWPDKFHRVVAYLKKCLESGRMDLTKKTSQQLVNGLCTVYRVPKISVKVLKKRPSRGNSEMHGLYEAEEGRPTVITVWMFTAKKKQVVAFKTFLRTLIHEFMHHMDYVYYKLKDSFHTEGFYKRESSLVRQLIEGL